MSEITIRNVAPDLDRGSIDYAAVQDPGHGNSAGAWTTVLIILLGSTIATVAFLMDLPLVVWIAGLAGWIGGPIVGAIVGKIAPAPAGHH
ncbi:DUF6704 family protein [Brevibacterium samyangense]|uniref:Uncharacterized protein n=1 Tax=Brevibacterium samyangense TaxID=366888 RepID=A0ABN2TG33_9MICO